MVDYRSLYDKDYIGAWDLQGDMVVTIMDVQGKKIKNIQTNKEERKPIITLENFEKRWVCNATNGATIANLYGPHIEKWRGKRITLYPTQVQAFGRMQDCIRVRPQIPAGQSKKASNEIELKGLDGSIKNFTRGGEWLSAFETMIKDATPQQVADLWTANSEAFISIQDAMQKGENTAAIERCNQVGKFAQERMAEASPAQ